MRVQVETRPTDAMSLCAGGTRSSSVARRVCEAGARGSFHEHLSAENRSRTAEVVGFVGAYAPAVGAFDRAKAIENREWRRLGRVIDVVG